MQFFWVGMILLLTSADHWTTYLCLREPIAGWSVTEANPLSAWLFGQLGLVPGLLLDSVVTLVALALVIRTTQFPTFVKTAVLVFVSLATGYAVINNMLALNALGMLPNAFGLA